MYKALGPQQGLGNVSFPYGMATAPHSSIPALPSSHCPWWYDSTFSEWYWHESKGTKQLLCSLDLARKRHLKFSVAASPGAPWLKNEWQSWLLLHRVEAEKENKTHILLRSRLFKCLWLSLRELRARGPVGILLLGASCLHFVHFNSAFQPTLPLLICFSLTFLIWVALIGSEGWLQGRRSAVIAHFRDGL